MPVAIVISPFKGELILNDPQYNMLIDRGVLSMPVIPGSAMAFVEGNGTHGIITFERVPLAEGVGVRVYQGNPNQLSRSVYVPEE